MDVAHPTSRQFSRISFGMMTPEQIRKLSVKLINNPEVYDHLNHPIRGGLYDPCLGPIDKNARCATCCLSAFQCPGHFGHIELPVPVYCPLTFGQMFALLKQACLYCHRLRMGPVKVAIFTAKLQLLDAGLYIEAVELDNPVSQREFYGSKDFDEKVQIDEAALVVKIRAYTQSTIKRHTRDGSTSSCKKKIGPIAEQRRLVIGEFLKRSGSTTVCHYCRGHSPSLHRHSNTKIFQMPLRKSLEAVMTSKGMNADAVFEEQNGANTECDDEGKILQDSFSDDASEPDSDEDAPAEKIKKKKGLSKSGTTSKAEMLSEKGMKYLTPIHILEHLRRLWTNEKVLLGLVFGSDHLQSNEQIFFTQVLAVSPCRFRPPSIFGDSQFDHPQNTYLSEILKLSQRLIELRVVDSSDAKKVPEEESSLNFEQVPTFSRLVTTWVQLQEQVNYLFDSSKNNASSGKLAPAGIKQILEKKEGLFRKHMMGKRVNFAARSVISPDVMLETNEIGVPMVFAKKLTYPEPVTAFNVNHLRQAVLNGPDNYPGASHVQMEDGTLAALDHLGEEARTQLAENLLPLDSLFASDTTIGGKKVLRHLRNGDTVLMNRQPTLHKPSMMTHRVRVLEGEKTLRMHYANCDSYNADFDGDEMNLHFPQNELARAECYTISNTDSQYLVPTDGSPLRGLIQDHVVTGVLVSLKDTFLDRGTYQQLLWGSLPSQKNRRILTMPPAIVRPKPLWTGKQLISTVLLNLVDGRPPLNLTCEGKLKRELWGQDHSDEARVIIQNGYFATGILDKNQIGASSFGLVHAAHELYGPIIAGQLLSTLGRLLTKYDQHYGFTCRMDDLLLTDFAESKRAELVEGSHALGRLITAEYAEVSTTDLTTLRLASERILRSDEMQRGLDGAFKGRMNTLTSRIISVCLPSGQLIPFPRNNMSLMTASGAKGSIVNFSQISGLLGQQELEGRRVPTMVSGKTLPSFRPYDSRARAGGFIAQRFLSGIRPQEFFFHCMAGREGLIDTAVKTSRSGYLQRCLVKHLESLRVHYDHTVRDSDGSVVQWFYGEDGLDVTKASYLSRFDFCWNNRAGLVEQVRPADILPSLERREAVSAAKKAWKRPFRHEPVMAKYPPSAHLGSVSDKFYEQLEEFLRTFAKNDCGDDESTFRALMWLKYMRSLVDPGEAVGLLAAQSLGEPSTQMTLNTFHFAGFGAKNVTLGIPRLREIIMTASAKIKTPTMTVHLRKEGGVVHTKDTVEKICGMLGKLTLAQLVRSVNVTERFLRREAAGLGSAAGFINGRRARVYSVVITMAEIESISSKYDFSIGLIKEAFETGFFPKLMSTIEKTIKKMRYSGSQEIVTSQAVVKEKGTALARDSLDDKEGPETFSDGLESRDFVRGKKKPDGFADDEFDSDHDELDAGEAKLAARRKQQATYDDDDNDKEDLDDLDIIDDGQSNDENDCNIHPESTSAKQGTALSDCRCIQNYSFGIKSVTFDLILPASSPKLALLLDMIERVVSEIVVRQIPGIQRCHASIDGSGEERNNMNRVTLMTEGVNLLGLWEYADILDLPSIYSNDISAILHVFGVEAARATIVREIGAVFDVYGISVDPRHLALIADWMTQGGNYKPFNRLGIDRSPSPLLKMTFETTVGFLRGSALFADSDDLISPSARLVMGMPVDIGTGSFTLCQQI